MSTVFSISPSRSVHDVNVTSVKGRCFVIDIYESTTTSYGSTVTVLDRISSPPGSWLYNVTPASSKADANFKAAVELIQSYLSSVDATDSITDIHNPCNCPFVPEAEQNSIVSVLNLAIKVRVN